MQYGRLKHVQLSSLVVVGFHVYILVRKRNSVSYGNTTKMDPGTNPKKKQTFFTEN